MCLVNYLKKQYIVSRRRSVTTKVYADSQISSAFDLMIFESDFIDRMDNRTFFTAKNYNASRNAFSCTFFGLGNRFLRRVVLELYFWWLTYPLSFTIFQSKFDYVHLKCLLKELQLESI